MKSRSATYLTPPQRQLAENAISIKVLELTNPTTYLKDFEPVNIFRRFFVWQFR